MDNQDSKEVKIVLIIVICVSAFLSLIIGVGYFVGRDSISSDEEDYIRDASHLMKICIMRNIKNI